jgi:hypothetical protein
VAIQKRHRQPAARTGSTPPTGAARSPRAVTPSPSSVPKRWSTVARRLDSFQHESLALNKMGRHAREELPAKCPHCPGNRSAQQRTTLTTS